MIICFSAFGCVESALKESEIEKEAKWIIYALNHGQMAVDGTNRKEASIPFEEVTVVETLVDTIGGDTIEVLFKFANKNTFCLDSFNYYLGWPFSCFGVGFVNNTPSYPICDLILQFPNSDSSKLFLQKVDEAFVDYLKSYQGEIDSWLLKEAKMRGVWD
jgi:hypothetical protein